MDILMALTEIERIHSAMGRGSSTYSGGLLYSAADITEIQTAVYNLRAILNNQTSQLLRTESKTR